MRERPEDVAKGLVQVWSDMFRLWTDFMGPLVPRDLGATAAWHEPHVHIPPRQERVRVMVDVSSPKRVEVRLELDPEARLDTLSVQALSPLGLMGVEPLSGARLERVDEHLTVRIQVPPGQPAGTYLGMIIDPEQAEQRGTLRVVVRD